MFEKDNKIKSDFDKSSCKNYLKKSFQQKNVTSPYTFPNWVKQHLESTAIFDQSLPTYQEVIKIMSLPI